MNVIKPKVLIVHNYYQIPGGEDTVVANEKRMLEQYGHEVILYTRNNCELNEMSKSQKLFLPINMIFNFRTFNDVKKLITEKEIDIIHVHNTLNLVSPSVYYAARICKVPIVQTIHNFRLLCPGATFYRNEHICEDCVKKGMICAIMNNCYRGSKVQTLACVISTMIHRVTGIYGKIVYICLTEFNKEKLLNLKQVKNDYVYVKPNFVKRNGRFIPEERRENRFIFAGRLDKLKGVDILLESWKQMGNNAPELLVCGTGPMESWCRKFVQDNKLNNVKIMGFISNIETRKLIANSKALILPTQWYEGFPMSIVEAFSVGTPVVCSDLGNAGNLVTENVNGTKFKCDSVDELINAVRRLISYKGIYNTTYTEYEKHYTESANYEKLIKIYRDSMDVL